MNDYACPNCGSGEVLPIEYGYPGLEMGEAAERGEIVPGGCLVNDIDRAWHCQRCDYEFGAKRH